MKALLVIIGGGLGAVTRYGVSLLAARLWGAAFPWGTLAVNLIGCLLIGLATGLAARSSLIPPTLRLFFVTGFLGGLTTFSSYANETIAAVNSGQPGHALANVLANNVVGLGLVAAGLWASRLVA
jgi:fluoride exporter